MSFLLQCLSFKHLPLSGLWSGYYTGELRVIMDQWENRNLFWEKKNLIPFCFLFLSIPICSFPNLSVHHFAIHIQKSGRTIFVWLYVKMQEIHRQRKKGKLVKKWKLVCLNLSWTKPRKSCHLFFTLSFLLPSPSPSPFSSPFCPSIVRQRAIYTQTGPRVSCSACTWRSSTSETCSGSARACRSWTGHILCRSTWAHSRPCLLRFCCRGGPACQVNQWSRCGGSSLDWGQCRPSPLGLGCWNACLPAPACPAVNKVASYLRWFFKAILFSVSAHWL